MSYLIPHRQAGAKHYDAILQVAKLKFPKGNKRVIILRSCVCVLSILHAGINHVKCWAPWLSQTRVCFGLCGLEGQTGGYGVRSQLLVWRRPSKQQGVGSI